jgi:penicillin-binding protein 1C
MFHVKHFCPIAGIFLTSLALGLAAAFVLFPPRSGAFDLETVNQGSHIVVDRNGVLLRAFTTPDGRWRLPVQASETDPRFLAMLIAYEDQRFYSHYGVDFLSLGRAALQWAGHGHIVSGGSTLTMQAARLLAPRAEKSVVAKLEQILRASGIERRTSKTGVLDLYLALAPYNRWKHWPRNRRLGWDPNFPARSSSSAMRAARFGRMSARRIIFRKSRQAPST